MSQKQPSEFTVKTTIHAPAKKIWGALADIGNISAWNPGVVASRREDNNTTVGPGANRHCDLGKGQYLKEKVTAWEPEKRLTMKITKTNLPFASADIRFLLNEVDENKTIVEVSPIYTLKFGFIGKIMDAVFIKRTYKKGMQNLLQGLKEYCEK